MGYKFFLQSFRHGVEEPLSEDAVAAAFAPFLDTRDPELWRLKYDDRNLCTLWPGRGDAGGVVFLSVDRPCGDRRLLQALHRILGMGNCVAYGLDGSGLAVASPHVAQHIPPDMIDTLGPLTVAPDADTLAKLL